MDTRLKIELHNAGLISDEAFGKVVAEILGENAEPLYCNCEGKRDHQYGCIYWTKDNSQDKN